MNKLILLFLLLTPLFCLGREYQVKIHVKNLPVDGEPVLLKIYNGNMYILDSTAVKDKEFITFEIPEDTHEGVLRAVLGITTYAKYTNGQPTQIDFLFNKEDIELSVDFEKPEESLEVIRSKENQVYFDFLKADALLIRKLGLLEQVVVSYPDKDEFYQKALEYYKKIQLQRDKFIDKNYAANRQLLAAKIINTKKMPFTEGDISAQTRDSIFKNQFLDKTEFTDTSLLYTNVYTDKMYQFIQMFMKRDAGPRENEASIIKAIDLLVPKIGANEYIQMNLMQFLIGGFEAMKMEEVLAHISANYLQQCGSSMDLVKRRLEGYQKMAIGKQVPDFTTLDINNNPVNLYSSVNPYTLVIFWHTDCSHCQALMDDLPVLYGQDLFKKHNVNIISISIDEKKESWEKYSQEHKLNWTNTFIEGAFNSEIASDYNLFATPSMFLLDDTHTIIAKPTTLEELKKNISEL